ncbi:uncharacterized protein LOC131601756 isoform X2 [Vicia villosa]|uniref:uncharacterized protein LOC131601756 isoform X2 n=1 Tax=Vicia villosa TaxID=3911 RepID=UPI00273C15A7|nr:uncharacterized protein LOC131601756 isoform X2 [Vicia villosa]
MLMIQLQATCYKYNPFFLPCPVCSGLLSLSVQLKLAYAEASSKLNYNLTEAFLFVAFCRGCTSDLNASQVSNATNPSPLITKCNLLAKMSMDLKNSFCLFSKIMLARCCDERVVTVYSSSGETNAFDDGGKNVSHAEDALFKIHDRVVAEELHSDQEEECGPQVTARLLVSAVR